MLHVTGPCINNEGLYTNAKGTMYFAIPTLLDSTAVAIGGDFAIAAPANEAKATGGVIVETTPK